MYTPTVLILICMQRFRTILLIIALIGHLSLTGTITRMQGNVAGKAICHLGSIIVTTMQTKSLCYIYIYTVLIYNPHGDSAAKTLDAPTEYFVRDACAIASLLFSIAFTCPANHARSSGDSWGPNFFDRFP